ncbi:SagB/ThcOx family dehydrogenase [Sulfuricurvum sp.]|uniref:SagB/ThcOx family dehydrogenase n=1 Tax=Sulfuricurvum sp. TaxID=2025608 RepID=UPI0019A187BE|nr:SagB/ThcOx family dehydrogenase [Sulfuricurvum sp.]MBD3806331.1 SagB/ThcOx family dehydrogenase [Sulfuricurvum sp.]
MKNIATALRYHDRTKHRPSRYAASLGFLDWTTQPDPFRRYPQTHTTELLHDDTTPPYHLLFGTEPLPKAPLCLESISMLLRYSLGLAAIKRHGRSEWALRCNASSGNLHPTECYLIAPPMDGISCHPTLSHYAPDIHALEVLHTYDTPVIENGFLLVLSSTIWREMWKYGERCWRYCQLDAGHAYGAIKIAATMLGWECSIVSIDTDEMGRWSGLNQHDRFHEDERESPDLMIQIEYPAFNLPEVPPLPSANVLSPSHHHWPIVYEIDEASQGIYPSIKSLDVQRHIPPPSQTAGEIILKRRSAQMMDRSGITQEHFRQLLNASLFCREAPNINFIIFVHRIEGLEKGLYAYLRNPDESIHLRESLDSTFLWKESFKDLYLLKSGDFQGAAQYISCNQEIASDGAFSFGMLCNFSNTLEQYGAVGYKNLYHQCGMIGQLLYLEATSLGLSATGIGCFLDDEFHTLLGICDQHYQSLYHFTIGRAIVDTRLTTLQPYTL